MGIFSFEKSDPDCKYEPNGITERKIHSDQFQFST